MICNQAQYIHSTQGFINTYFEQLKNSENNREAYLKTETEYMRYFKQSKYNSFESFKVILYRYYRKKR